MPRPGSRRSKRERPDHSSEENRAFLQTRLALLGRVLFVNALAGYLALAALSALFRVRDWGATGPPYNYAHLGVIVVAGTIWLGCCVLQLTPRALLWVDVLGSALIAIGCAAHGFAFEVGEHGEMAILGAACVCVAARAVIVPSTTRRTLAIGLLFAALAVAGTYATHSRGAAPPPHSTRAVFAMGVLVWCGIFAAMSAMASGIIFGLRQQVREAASVGQYVLDEKIAEGGMGVVFKARHALLRRPTAVKLMHADIVSEAALRRFEREVQLTSSLSHPNTIAVYDYGRTPEGVFYYAMEYLPGEDLQHLVERSGPVDAGRVIHILRQVCGSLAEAHDIGLIHRDIKPANIMLCTRGGIEDVVKVLDFGLVRESGTDMARGLTMNGCVVGTPDYLAPEMLMHSEDIGPPYDLYAVGAVGYFLLTGTPVFDGTSIAALCRQHLYDRPQRPSHRTDRPIPGDLEAIVLRCLAKEPSDRPQDAHDLRDMLDACANARDWSPAQKSTKSGRAAAVALTATRPRASNDERHVVPTTVAMRRPKNVA